MNIGRLAFTGRALTLAAAGLGTLGVSHAQDVTYQENLGGGDSATLALQHYAAGSALSDSNFVSFSLDVGSGAPFSVSSSEFFKTLYPGQLFGTLSGRLSTTDPAIDTLTVGIPVGNAGTGSFLFVQKDGSWSYDYQCGSCGGGKNNQSPKKVVPRGDGFLPATSAPELDVNSAYTALTMLLGGLLVLRARFRRT